MDQSSAGFIECEGIAYVERHQVSTPAPRLMTQKATKCNGKAGVKSLAPAVDEGVRPGSVKDEVKHDDEEDEEGETAGPFCVVFSHRYVQQRRGDLAHRQEEAKLTRARIRVLHAAQTLVPDERGDDQTAKSKPADESV